MRSHGVPDFPDPGGPRPSGDAISILGIFLPPTTDIKSPAFQSGLQACFKRMRGGAPPRAVSPAQKQAALAFSRCMRAHGIRDFPDPVFAPDGGIGIGVGKENPDSPAFQRAQTACGNP